MSTVSLLIFISSVSLTFFYIYFSGPTAGPILEPSVGKLDGITGGYIQSSMITPIDPSQSAKQRVRQNPSSVDAKKNVHHKKAADGLSKGHAVVLLLNGEEVGKARIISCERFDFLLKDHFFSAPCFLHEHLFSSLCCVISRPLNYY